MHIPRILALVLAGGKNSRLRALTEKKVKPALLVAGTYRLIDLAVPDRVQSHISDVRVVQQYLPHSSNVHLANGRPWHLGRTHGGLQMLTPYEGGAGGVLRRGQRGLDLPAERADRRVRRRPILSAQPQRVPARIAGSTQLHASMVAAGAIVRAVVEHSVHDPGVVVEKDVTVRHCVPLEGVPVAPGVSRRNVVADVGADISGGSRRGSPTGMTLIRQSGMVTTTEDFDRSAVLPDGA